MVYCHTFLFYVPHVNISEEHPQALYAVQTSCSPRSGHFSDVSDIPGASEGKCQLVFLHLPALHPRKDIPAHPESK